MRAPRTLVRLLTAVVLAAGGLTAAAPASAASRLKPTVKDISCPAPTSCWATVLEAAQRTRGEAVSESAVRHWDGKRWRLTVLPVPVHKVPADNYVGTFADTITCVSVRDCWAAGRWQYGNNTSYQQLAWHYDGHRWTVFPVPNRPHAVRQGAGDLGCVSASDCLMVDYWEALSSPQVLRWGLRHFDGHHWKTLATPRLSVPFAPSGLSCTADACTLDNASQPFNAGNTLMRYRGGRLLSVATQPAPVDELASARAMSCSRTGPCFIVGNAEVAYPNQADLNAATTVFGGVWTTLSPPNPGGDTAVPAPGGQGTTNDLNELDDVSCPAVNSCWAVGYYFTNPSVNDDSTPQALHWDGSAWSVAVLPSTRSSHGGELSQISCASVHSCWAVGMAANSGDGVAFVGRTLYFHFDGTRWTG